MWGFGERGVDRAGHGHHRTVATQRPTGGVAGARPQRGLHDHRSQRERGDQSVPGEEAHAGRSGPWRQLRHQQSVLGQAVEDGCVPARIGHVDAVGEDADRRATCREGTTMGRHVDPVRPAGHDGDTGLGEIRGHVGGHAASVVRAGTGADEGGRALEEFPQVTRAAQPQAERDTASALDRVTEPQRGQGLGPFVVAGDHEPRATSLGAGQSLPQVSLSRPRGDRRTELTGEHPIPGGASALERRDLTHSRLATLHGKAEGQPRTALGPAGHETTLI